MGKLNKARSIFKEDGVIRLITVSYNFVINQVHKVFRSNKIFDRLAFYVSNKKLNKRNFEESSLEDILDTAYNFSGLGYYRSINPSQVREELYEMLSNFSDEEIERIIEIGSKEGGTMYGWIRFLKPSQFISVDLPEGDFGGGYPKEKGKFYQQFGEDSIELIRQNSHNEKTKEKVKEKVEGSVDLLFIDGDHTYEGVKKDFEMYSELVSEGGYVVFHDINPHPELPRCNVDKFWEEIKEDYDTKEIIKNKEQGWAGIGIIKL